MKYEVKFTSQFNRYLKLAKKQGRDIDALPCWYTLGPVLKTMYRCLKTVKYPLENSIFYIKIPLIVIIYNKPVFTLLE